MHKKVFKQRKRKGKRNLARDEVENKESTKNQMTTKHKRKKDRKY